MSACDHSWPGDLDADTPCEKCGLPYGQWEEDDQRHPCACNGCKYTATYADEAYCFGCEPPSACSCGCSCTSAATATWGRV